MAAAWREGGVGSVAAAEGACELREVKGLSLVLLSILSVPLP